MDNSLNKTSMPYEPPANTLITQDGVLVAGSAKGSGSIILHPQKKISIFIITRKRIPYLKNLLDSIQDKAHDINNLEIYIGMDDDDTETIDFLKNVAQTAAPAADCVGCICQEKSIICDACKQRFLNRHRDLLLPMTEAAKGDYFWILNDDVVIETRDFDKILLEQIENHLSKFPDRILYGKVKEIIEDPVRMKSANGAFASYPFRMSCSSIASACYPLISRELYKVLGWFLPPDISNNGADTALHQILTDCKYDRLVSFPDIVLRDRVLDDIEKHPDHKCASRLRADGSSLEELPRKLIKLLSGEIEEWIELMQSIQSGGTEVQIPT